MIDYDTLTVGMMMDTATLNTKHTTQYHTVVKCLGDAMMLEAI